MIYLFHLIHLIRNPANSQHTRLLMLTVNFKNQPCLIRRVGYFSATPRKCAQHVLRFPDLLFSCTRLVELLLWLDKPNPTTSGNVMGNFFVLFDVSIVISHGQFHCGSRGHTQNTNSRWVKSHFAVGKRSSGTATNLSSQSNLRLRRKWRKEIIEIYAN